MSDLEKYIRKREKKNPNFRRELEEERRNLRIGMLIKELRLEKGMTQEDYDGKDISGKIVLTTGRASMIYRSACIERDAIGFLTYIPPSGNDEIANMYEAYHDLHPPGGEPGTFYADSWHPNREGHERLATGLYAFLTARGVPGSPAGKRS